MGEHTIILKRKMLVAWLLRNAAKISTCYHNVVVEGEHNIPNTGTALLLPKHQFMRDIMIEGVMLYKLKRRYAHYIMKASLPWFIRIPYEYAGGVTIDRPKDIRSIKNREKRKRYLRNARAKTARTMCYISWLYATGEWVVAHPEGTRCQGEMGIFQMGIIEHAIHTEKEHNITIPIIPIGFEYENHRTFRSRVIVRIGEPVYTNQLCCEKQLAEELTYRIATLSNLK